MAVRPSVRLLNGHSMPIVGLGTWLSKIGEVGNAVRVALDAGYRHIDTAQNYYNEEEIGEALEEKVNEGKVKREDVFITTKLAMAGMAPENVKKETLLSLKRLRTDYIDLYLIHHPVSISDEGMSEEPPVRFPKYKNGALKTSFIDPLDTWREMEKLVDEGLVRAIGLSNVNKQQLQRIFEKARIKPANLQVECHAWFPQYEMAEFCEKRGIAFSAYGPIGSPGRPPVEGPATPPLMDEPALKEIASKHEKTVAQVLLRNLMQRGIIVLPKSVTPERIKSNFQVMDFELSPEEMDIIKGINKELRLFQFNYYGKQNFLHPFFPWPELAQSYQPGQGMEQL
ncbi:aldose reductase-related protein 2-like [Watersipora subatra]|uniref:aldose reductase-related protein 2-like n=1 Tax=Watersipora subatra TaxID=2589382 RepID=UPI00355C119D